MPRPGPQSAHHDRSAAGRVGVDLPELRQRGAHSPDGGYVLMANDREIIEAKLRQHNGQAIGDPGHTAEHIAEQIAAALRESRKADVDAATAAIEAADEIIAQFFAQWGDDYLVKKWGLDEEVASFRNEQKPAALAALSRLAGDE
jgi:hypothetical protein